MFLMVGCKSITKSGNYNVVIGTAKNVKYGAILSGNDEVYAISGLQTWDSIYLDKKVKLKGNFELRIGEDKVEIKNSGTFQAQSYPRYYLVKDATWELYSTK
ncbi:hypothetical protein NU10_09495 [Flavobacterium dauae]|uniref:hypothetical protein n=1 Tax=Flavobacterium dauae TaxID=1563479 RepID=UPI0013EBBD0A|nr:hypothetical protein [Flavobacterium dauae]WLD22952.1 hypothetical protein NU10_09495 [Flavobacterium dauae]